MDLASANVPLVQDGEDSPDRMPSKAIPVESGGLPALGSPRGSRSIKCSIL